MAMTKQERATRSYLLRYLRQNGYPTYASILLKFDLNFHRKKIFFAKMIPGKYRILINPEIDDPEVLCLLIRHEILHEYLKHENRMLKHLAELTGQNFDDLDDESIKDLTNKLYVTKLFNYAADYEISNRGYTERDKELTRHIGLLTGISKNIRGLVTEDKHPEWINDSVEEMWDKLQKQREQDQKTAQENTEQNQKQDEDVITGIFIPDKGVFIDTVNNVVYAPGGGR